MPVSGQGALLAALRAMPDRARAEIAKAVQQGAEGVLEEMKRLTPVDPETPKHARDGLTISYESDGQVARIGLPTNALAEEFFWWRFLDGGTKGYTAGDTRRTAKNKTTKKVRRNIPARPALRIRERALDANRDEIERLVRMALAAVLKKV